MAFGYPIDFDTMSAAATEAAKLNAILKKLQKECKFSIHVDGHHDLLFDSASRYGYQPNLRSTVEDWLMNRIADQVQIIERELAKRG